MANNAIDINVDEKEFAEALRSFERMEEAIEPRWLKNTQRRKAKPMVEDMRRSTKSARLPGMIGVTTAKKRSGRLGIKVGVVKNDSSLFPEFSAEAFASVLEYGTAERYRQLKAVGLVTGRQSTGEMPAAPFLRPSWDRNVKAFMADTEQAILDKIEREA